LPGLVLHNGNNFLMKLLLIGKVRELSHQAIDEVLKITGEIYEQEH